MTPFQEFRLWARRAPNGERAAATTAALLALALLLYVLVPTGGPAEDTLGFGEQSGAVVEGGQPVTEPGAAAPDGGTAGGGDPVGPGSTGSTGTTGGSAGTTGTTGGSGGPAGGPGTTGSTGSTGGTTGGSGSAGTTGGTTGTAGKSCPGGSAPGASAGKLKIAIILVKIVGPAANSIFGIDSPEQQRKYWEAIVKDLNANGGSGCRQLVPTFYEGNPGDRNSLKELCLEIAAKGFYAAIDNGAYAQFPVVECYPQNKVTYFGSYLVSETVRQRSFPYIFQFNSADDLYRDTVFALRDRGFYKDGFKKLAFPYRTCDPEVVKKMRTWFGQAGISKNQIVEYDFGCPNGFASPSDVQQAVLTFQREGATHLTYAGFVGDFAAFTRIAEQQNYRPKYGLPNDSLIPLSKGSGAPDKNNIAGAIAIAASRDGEENTPGSKPTAGTQRCSKILGTDVYKLAAIAGNSCSVAWMFDAAVDNAPQIAREALPAGLQKAGSVDFSFPQGPTNFRAKNVTTGGQFWRTTQFVTACGCWRVVDPTYRKAYGG